MFNKLQSKLTSNKSKGTPLTPIFQTIKELGGLGDVLGRTFEVYDMNDKLTHKIVQKPIKLNQMNMIINELSKLNEYEQAMMNSKKKH